MEINQNNILPYLSKKTGLLKEGEPVTVTELNYETDHYAEGYINFIYRVKQGAKSFIVKQARPYLRVPAIADSLPISRNYLEYISFHMRKEIVKNYVPEVYFVDAENGIFVMEDLSRNMKILRFELCRGQFFHFFAEQIGEFLAKIHFYTSELYLSKQVFCDLHKSFINVDMRSIMEDIVLLKNDIELECQECGALKQIAEDIWENPKTRLEMMLIRDVFKKKAECLIHGDLHPSNIFVDDRKIRVIDMEYSFIGPFGYDLGYLLANFISQFSAFSFNTQFTVSEREGFQRYLLDTLVSVFDVYFRILRECFEQDARDAYKMTAGYLERLFIDILHDALGFMSSANMSRIINMGGFPDFDCIPDANLQLLAKGLSLTIDEFFLLNRKAVISPAMIKKILLCIQREYLIMRGKVLL